MGGKATGQAVSTGLLSMAMALATGMMLTACAPSTASVGAPPQGEAPATSGESVSTDEKPSESSPTASTEVAADTTGKTTDEVSRDVRTTTSTDSSAERTGTITVSTQAEVEIAPDTASFGVTITSKADSASDAQRANARPTQDVIDTLKEAGVPAKSIQTTTSSVGPSWSATDESENAAQSYEATTHLQVSDVEIDKVASLMEAATAAGATAVDGPSYAASDYDDAYDEALTNAVKAARPKAESVAKAAGVSIGKVVGVAEGRQDTLYRAESAVADAGITNGVAIEPGRITVTADVTVSFAIS